jgi:dipeptidyl aminopeptidase/acylaminoacyl peptidase
MKPSYVNCILCAVFTSFIAGCASGSATSPSAPETAANAETASVQSPKAVASTKKISDECKSQIVQMVTKQDGSHQYLLADATLWQTDGNDSAKLIKKLPDSADNYKLIPSDDVIIHYTNDKIMIVHIETGTELFRLAGDPKLKNVLFSPDNQEMATQDSANVFNIWNVPKRFSGIKLTETVQDFINRQSPDARMKFSVDPYAVSLTNEGKAVLATDDAATQKTGLIYFMDDKNAKGSLKAIGRTNVHIAHLAIALSGNNIAAVDENGQLYVSSTGEDKGFKIFARNFNNLINAKFVGEDVLAIDKDKLTRIDIATGNVKWIYKTSPKSCYAPSSEIILCTTGDTIEEIDGNGGTLKRVYFFTSSEYGIIEADTLKGTAPQSCYQ